MSLEDISKSNAKDKKSDNRGKGAQRGGRTRGGGGRGGRGRGRGGPVRNRRRQPSATPYARQDVKQPKSITLKKNKRVLVSNLSNDLTEDDIWEVFVQMNNGRDKIKDLTLNYTRDGTFNGTVFATFHSAHDAEALVKEFDGAQVDKREIYLDFIVRMDDLSNNSTQANNAYQEGQGYQSFQNNQGYGELYRDEYYGTYGGGGGYQRRGSGRRGRRGGRRGGGGRGRGTRKPAASKKPAAKPKKPLTTEELDKQLDDWHNQKNNNSSAGKD
eukprot:CAMPEP_0170179530 /NCGR_PEP_ID=MMETSP0040_2-20121228/18192_1 /TAXON_ID=641309 /ORGANISM="Lotharella oceanica, Strain CCMP622" /LENGTH=270 /DNA_ID=CAMNT_0010423693 /DNA_START=8 /DNA_END=820 /DNA_ORIENTATION=+